MIEQIALQVDFASISQGFSIMIVGIMGILLAVILSLKNMLAGVMWSFAGIFLILSGTLGIGLEYYWLSTILTLILILVGMVVRWS